MKKVGVLLMMFFLIGFYSCNPKCPNTQQANIMGHLYKVYKGKLKTDDNLTRRNYDNFKFIKFNDSIRKYYYSDTNNVKFIDNNEVNVYQYIQESNIKGKNDTIIVLKNKSLRNNSDSNNKELKARGKYGCIPRFEENPDGTLYFFTDISNNKFLNLMIAEHDHSLKEISYLNNYIVSISDVNYIILNDIYQRNKEIEAGINTGVQDTLIVFDDKNNFTLSFFSSKVKK